MSYLSYLPGGGITGATRAVISLWFRVPKETLDKATQEWEAWVKANEATKQPRKPLTGIVPLMTFGPPSKQIGTDSTQVAVGIFPQFGIWHWNDFNYPDCSLARWTLIEDPGITPAQPFTAGHDIPNSKRFDLDPSYIGVDVTGPYPALSVNIVMPLENKSAVRGSLSRQTGYANSAAGIPDYGSAGLCPDAPVTYFGPFGLQMETVQNPPSGFSSVWTTTDSYDGSGPNLLTTRPEMFRLLPSSRVRDDAGILFKSDLADQTYGGQKVEPDHWHHLLLSFDLSSAIATNGESVTQSQETDPHSGLETSSSTGKPATLATAGARTSSACKMWVAFDDKNLTGKSLSAYWPNGYSDPNGIITVTGLYAACDTTYNVTTHVYDINGTDVTSVTNWVKPSYNFTPAAVSLSPLGLPSIATYVDAVKRVEMAELQFFVGVTVDPKNTAVRRAFIGKDGKPVSPTQKQEKDDNDQITKDSGSIELLMKEPEILLHGSSNWKKGISTSQPDPRRPASKSQEQLFTPTGGIETYKPDPNLHGDQGEKAKDKPGVGGP